MQPSFVAADIVFSDATVVFVPDPMTFPVLNSSIHSLWAFQYGSSLAQILRYTPSDCLETFPFPEKTADSALPGFGDKYHLYRKSVMLSRQSGLTDTYNLFHNPDEASADIQKFRQLHIEMDNAVITAYGWTDLDLGHGFHETKQGVRYTISEPARREVLARLLKLNHERYAEEVKQGLHEKKKGGARRVKGGGEKRQANTDDGLFE